MDFVQNLIQNQIISKDSPMMDKDKGQLSEKSLAKVVVIFYFQELLRKTKPKQSQS